MATIILPKLLTFLGNFGKGCKIFHFSAEIIYWATFIDIWRLFTGHTDSESSSLFHFTVWRFAKKLLNNVAKRKYWTQIWWKGTIYFLFPWCAPTAEVYECVVASSGLVVTWGDSCCEGCGFESQCRILDGHFSYLFVVKKILFGLFLLIF